jgi:crotonobetainyl-CoA:carnitine CoA-transferase CaiB-like acyl-CoA transferase
MTQLSAVGVPAGAVLDSMELTNEPSFRARGILQTMTHGERTMTMPTWRRPATPQKKPPDYVPNRTRAGARHPGALRLGC